MSKHFFNKLKNTVTGGAIIIAFFSILSRLLGLLRDRLLASTFGAGDVLDCYYAAFKLPDVIFNTFIVGALSVSFIPVFLQYWKKNKKEAWEISSSILNIVLVFLFVLGAVFFIFASKLIPTVITPGFTPEKQELTIRLTRIMMVGILFLGASNVASSILNSFKKFLAFGLASVMYNLGIIFGILLLVPVLGPNGLAFGVVVGTVLHFFIQIPDLLKVGYKWKGVLRFRHPAVKKIGLLMLPRMFGLAVNQINQLVIVIIASTLASGSLAIFNLANNLQHVPIGVFGISLAIASFPYLSESVSEKNFKKFTVHFSVTFRRILFLIIPVAVLMILLRAQIVRIVLGAGVFGWEDTILTFRALGFFAFSLFAHALIPLMARCFYALQDTKTPVLISIFSLSINIVGGIFLGRYIGAPGLALAFSIAILVNAILLFVFLKIKVGWLDERKIVKSLAKISFVSIIMAMIVQLTKHFLGNLVNMQTFWGILIQFSGSATAGIIIYILLSFAFKCEEVEIIRRKLFTFINNKKTKTPINIC
ncbi:MAG: murein biosynthesis integral membrane protein MurJ [Armatimonadetes bacterium]|nr:murein biosynthesis integral membrane protein MurJ [Armatimonadota bacterium]